jgi:hypothetical protein
MAIEIETKLEFKMYLRLMYTLTYKKPIMFFLSFIGMVMFIGAILYFIGFNIPVDGPPYFQLMFGFFTVGIIPIIVFRTAKKNFCTHGRLQEKMKYEFTDEKIRVTGETFYSEFDWAKLYKITELKHWILLYQNKIIANLIPKESFGEKFGEFKGLIQTKNIKLK